MSNPIYAMWRLNLRPAIDENTEILKAISEQSVDALAEVGGETVLQLDTHWSSQWQRAGVTEYPDLAALQAHTQHLEQLEWFRYYECETLLGEALFHEDIDMPNPIYVMWRLSLRPAKYALPEEKVQHMQQVRNESLARIGSKKVLQLDTRWSNGKWQFAGVVKHPNLEALQTFRSDLLKIGWYHAVEDDVITGIELKEA